MDFNIIKLDYNNRIRNLDAESKGEVKSKKYFPVFNIEGREYIFKPLSKSKPFCTPTFALSEVYWSNIINKYFDDKTPIYRLSICENQEEDKYRKQGTLVPNLVSNDERLVNLLEYFRNNPDKNVDIDKYINYCGQFYDYTSIFNSELIVNNRYLGEQLAKQVLLSILKGDINYHYENVNFIYEGNTLKGLAPSIDHEFSSVFIYPDMGGIFTFNLRTITDVLNKEEVNKDFDSSWPLTSNKQAILDNINLIAERYPNVVKEFIGGINALLDDINQFEFKIDENYFYTYSSFDFEEYKNEGHLTRLFNPLNQKSKIDVDEYSNTVKKATTLLATSLKNILTKKIKNNNKLILENNDK